MHRNRFRTTICNYTTGKYCYMISGSEKFMQTQNVETYCGPNILSEVCICCVVWPVMRDINAGQK